MKKNFKKLEVGRRYRNRGGDVVRIVSLGVAGPYPFKGHDNRKYTATGVCYEISNRLGLIELLPEEPTTRLVELEAKRAELDKEIEELKSNLIAPKLHFEHVVVDLPNDEMRVYTLPFTRVKDEWEPAFEIVPK